MKVWGKENKGEGEGEGEAEAQEVTGDYKRWNE